MRVFAVKVGPIWRAILSNAVSGGCKSYLSSNQIKKSAPHAFHLWPQYVLLFPVLHSRLSWEGLCRHHELRVALTIPTSFPTSIDARRYLFQLIDSSENDVGIGTCRRRCYFSVLPLAVASQSPLQWPAITPT
jgi:hypothetical protein